MSWAWCLGVASSLLYTYKIDLLKTHTQGVLLYVLLVTTTTATTATLLYIRRVP